MLCKFEDFAVTSDVKKRIEFLRFFSNFKDFIKSGIFTNFNRSHEFSVYRLTRVAAAAVRLWHVHRLEVFLKPIEDTAVSEISSVLKEWKPLWHQLFTVR